MRDIINPSGVCRCCLKNDTEVDLHQLHSMDGEDKLFKDLLIECFNLYLSSDIRLPSEICCICMGKLRDAQEFRQLIVFSEEQLLNTLGNTATEFVDLGDPLIVDVKSEAKYELPVADATKDIDCGIQYEYEKELMDNLVPMERELLCRFSSITPLPTRNSLQYLCPKFYKHLESLKGKVIYGNTIKCHTKTRPKRTAEAKPTKTSKRPLRKTRKRPDTSKFISVKLAQVLNAITILENCNAAIFKSKSQSGFPCFYCRDIFSNLKLLRDHQTVHPKSSLFKLLTKYTADTLIIYAEITNLKCTICDREIDDMADLKQHLKVDHDKRLYDDFSDRIIPFKLDDKESNFNCHICGAYFETFGSLDKHMSTHNRNFICDECGAGFMTKHRLKIHIYLLHKPPDNVLKCELCKKLFPTKHKLKIHDEYVHKKLKKIRCSICSEKFLDYFARQRHMEEKHGVEPILYKCTKCDQSFNRKYSLTCHFKRRHLQKRDVQCEVCPFMCYSKTELTEHMVKHNGGKGFECQVCSKSFVRQRALKIHMRVHTDDKRYSCHLCGETFVQNWNLKSHLKTHGVSDG